MTSIQLTGSLPGRINENTAPWDWTGQFRLSLDPALIRYVDVAGFGADFFDVSLNRSTGMLTITPLSRPDYEWFVAHGISPTISFTLRFYMMDGTVAESLNTYAVTLLDSDDTPPQALGFASGGIVAAGAAGASIGRLAVTDPDTASGFTFTIQEDEQWMFEIVGGVLKLRAGVSIPLADGPERPLVITVSDGHQSAAFTLQIGVTVTAINQGGTVDLLETHERACGFHWATASDLVSLHLSFEIASIRDYGALIHLELRDGGAITFEQPAAIDLLDGYITFAGNSWEGRVWAIYETVLDREPHNSEMLAGVTRLANGGTSEAMLADLLNSAEFRNAYGALNNSAFIERLYRNSVGWTDASGIAYHAGHLDRGRSRAVEAAEFVEWRIDSLHHADQRAENGGFFVPRAWAVDAWNRTWPAELLDSGGIAEWWADQVISGDASPDVFGSELLLAMGLRPALPADGRADAVERFFTRMVGAPAASTWGSAFADLTAKTGETPHQFLAHVIHGIDLAEAYAHQMPTGIAFQNVW